MKIFYNGNILTDEKVESVVCTNKIIDMGPFSKMQEKYSSATMIDLKGKTLMPSFIDSHSHITMAANVISMTDLSEATSFLDIITLLKNDLKDKKILLGFGYDHNVLKENAHPTKKELDEVSKNIPIFIMNTSGHMGVVNSKMLDLLGINKDTKIPGGKIGVIDGEASGYLEEGALMLISKKLSSNIATNIEENIIKALNMYASYGITTVQDGASDIKSINLLEKMNRENKLFLDVVAYPLMNEENIEFTKNFKESSSSFKLGGYKIILDGSPQGKSAWMSEPYVGTDYMGYPWMKDIDVTNNIKEAIKEKRQVLAHCNGDNASEQFINCYKEALKDDNDLTLRPVMIHCQTVREDQIKEMAKLKMIASIFIGHTYYWGDVHLRNFGEKRGNFISPANTALKNNLIVTFHQDTPVTKPNMFHSIWCAVNRITKSGRKIGESECISVMDAIKSVTINAAFQYNEENEKGSISIGKRADLIVVSDNPLTIDKMKIKDIIVLNTYKDGKLIYKRG